MLAPSGNHVAIACARRLHNDRTHVHMHHALATPALNTLGWGLAIDRAMGSHVALRWRGVVLDAVWWVARLWHRLVGASCYRASQTGPSNHRKIRVSPAPPYFAHVLWGTCATTWQCQTWQPLRVCSALARYLLMLGGSHANCPRAPQIVVLESVTGMSLIAECCHEFW